MVKVGIVGAGMSGIASAHYIHSQIPDADLTIFERTDRAGGHIRSETHGGHLIEFGPHHFSAGDQELIDLIEDIGLSGEQRLSDASSNHHFVYRNQQFVPIPQTRMQWIRSPLTASPLKTLWKDWTRKPADVYDSLKSFGYRHFGKGMTQTIVDAQQMRNYYGDINKLSTNAVLPNFKSTEREKGSALPLYHKQKSCFLNPDPAGFVTINGGLQRIVESTIAHHNLNILYHQQVRTIKDTPDGKVEIRVNDRTYTFDHVILTTPSFVSAHLLRDCNDEFYRTLGLVKYVPLAVVNLIYDYDCIRQNGNGYTIPSCENQQILSVSWNHKMFPDQQREDHASLTVYLGGTLNPEILEKPAHIIVRTALNQVKKHLQISSDPVLVKIRQYSRAIPQYNMGIEKVWARLDAVKDKHPNIHLVSNYQYGIQLNDCVKLAKSTVEKIAAQT